MDAEYIELDTLAGILARNLDIDQRSALALVRDYTRQLADDPDMVDATGRRLTPAGTNAVARAAYDTYRVDAVHATTSTLLTQIERTRDEAFAALELHRAHLWRRDQLIRAAMRTAADRADIAAAAGITTKRLYQILTQKKGTS